MLCDESHCTGCGACVNVCPHDAVSLDFKHWRVSPTINQKRCNRCGRCERSCPVLNLNDSQRPGRGVCFVGWSINQDLRKRSSSGGIFSAIADQFLQAGGVVYGAAFDSFSHVAHLRISERSDLELLQGSKYVTSEIGMSYRDVLSDLRNGRRVLFSGLPCQIAGLESFLGGVVRENLFTVDLVCHGAPWPMAFNKFCLAVRKKQKIAGPAHFHFRADKAKTGWNESGSVYVSWISGGGEIQVIPRFSNWYMQAFLRAVSFKPICYTCPVAGVKRKSDVTIGDFWGAGLIFSPSETAAGVSCVVANSKKGVSVLSESGLMLRKTTLDAISAANPNILHATPKPAFFSFRRWCIRHLPNSVLVLLFGRFVYRLEQSVKFRIRAYVGKHRTVESNIQ